MSNPSLIKAADTLNAAEDAYREACLDVVCGKDRRDLAVLAFREGRARIAYWQALEAWVTL